MVWATLASRTAKEQNKQLKMKCYTRESHRGLQNAHSHIVLFVILRESSLTVPSAAYPATPSSTPADGTFCHDAPIQFDLTTPGTSSSPKEGPPKYVER